MSSGNSTLTVDYGKDKSVVGSTPDQTAELLNKKLYGNTALPPPLPTLSPTDQLFANARKAQAFSLLQGDSRKDSFLTGAAGVDTTGLITKRQLLGL